MLKKLSKSAPTGLKSPWLDTLQSVTALKLGLDNSGVLFFHQIDPVGTANDLYLLALDGAFIVLAEQIGSLLRPLHAEPNPSLVVSLVNFIKGASKIYIVLFFFFYLCWVISKFAKADAAGEDQEELPI